MNALVNIARTVKGQCDQYLWTHLAYADLGKAEIKGSRTAQFILDAAKRAGLTWVRDDETPWCATWVSGKLEEAGVPSTRSAWARSYCAWKGGHRLSGPRFGSVVVFERGPKSGHVGFVVGFDKDHGIVWVLGGNQGDMVSIKPFPVSRVLGYFWPNAVHPNDSVQLVAFASNAIKLSTNEA